MRQQRRDADEFVDLVLRSMALLMPVSCSMNAGTRTPAFIRLW
ncbi:hypothetical protein ACVK1X_005896 [Pseudomonas sp. PvR086]